MSAVSADEVTPGLVVHLSPEILKAQGGSKVRCPVGTEVRANHYFLVVSVGNGMCLATPLYPEKGSILDRIALQESHKTGKPENWIGQSSFYFKWQFWCIPVSSVVAASVDENSSVENRRQYQKYADVMKDLNRLREEWRDV